MSNTPARIRTVLQYAWQGFRGCYLELRVDAVDEFPVALLVVKSSPFEPTRLSDVNSNVRAMVFIG